MTDRERLITNRQLLELLIDLRAAIQYVTSAQVRDLGIGFDLADRTDYAIAALDAGTPPDVDDVIQFAARQMADTIRKDRAAKSSGPFWCQHCGRSCEAVHFIDQRCLSILEAATGPATPPGRLEAPTPGADPLHHLREAVEQLPRYTALYDGKDSLEQNPDGAFLLVQDVLALLPPREPVRD